MNQIQVEYISWYLSKCSPKCQVHQNGTGNLLKLASRPRILASGPQESVFFFFFFFSQTKNFLWNDDLDVFSSYPGSHSTIILKNHFPRNIPVHPIYCKLCFGDNHAPQIATHLSFFILKEIIINYILKLSWEVEIIYIYYIYILYI